MKPSSKREAEVAYVIIIPTDLSVIDDDCKVWARVVRDHGPAYGENAIARAMRLYGEKEQYEAPPTSQRPLTEEQKARAWEIDEIVKKMPWRQRGAIIAWYLVPLSNPSWVARRMKITLRELGQRLIEGLRLIEAHDFRKKRLDEMNEVDHNMITNDN